MGGHLHVLKWLQEENNPPCPWDENTCDYAAERGHLQRGGMGRGWSGAARGWSEAYRSFG